MSVKDRRKREIAARKNDILAAAEIKFQKSGYENTTMDEIAREAELSKGTLYLYYRTKEELYLGISVKALKIMLERFKQAAAKGSTGLEKIRLIGQTYIEYAIDSPFYFDCQLHFESRNFEAISDYKIFQEHIEQMTRINTIVFDAVDRGIKDGSIRADLQSELTGMLLWAFSSGFIKFVIRNEEEFANYFSQGREPVLKAFFDLLLNGIKA